MRHVEQSLAALDALDLGPADKLAFWGVVDDYVFGSALRTVASLSRMAASKKNPTLLADATAFTGQQREQPLRDQFAHGKKANPHRSAILAAQFERGLNALLDGLMLSMNLR